MHDIALPLSLKPLNLVIDQGYTQEAAAKAMNVGKSTVSKWVTQLQLDAPKASPMTPEQIEIRALKPK